MLDKINILKCIQTRLKLKSMNYIRILNFKSRPIHLVYGASSHPFTASLMYETLPLLMRQNLLKMNYFEITYSTTVVIQSNFVTDENLFLHITKLREASKEIAIA